MSVFLSASHNDPASEIAAIETFHRRRVDGVIIAAAQISDSYAQRLANVKVPTVLLNQQAELLNRQSDPPHARLHAVSVDDYGGARLAVAHLMGLGHRRIGYLGAGNRPRSNRLRMQGYRDALAAEVAWNESWVRTTPPERRRDADDVTDGQMLLSELIDAGVTAVFCYNDMIAIGALLACRARGIGVPEELSLVGYDDIETAQYVSPPLTTIHQPRLRLGQLAMEMLLDLLADREVQDRVLPTELIVRASTSKAPR